MTPFSDFVRALDCPSDIAQWAEPYGSDWRRAYRECERGDWLLCILASAGLDRPRLVLAACACARTALKYVKKGERRPLTAIRTAEAWARGTPGVSLEDVKKAAQAAYAAIVAYAAYAAYAAYVADASAAAAHAATAAYSAYSAAKAAHAASASAHAEHAASAHATDARSQHLQRCAVIVRKHVPWRHAELVFMTFALAGSEA